LSLISKLLRRGSKAGGEPSSSDRGGSSFGKSIVGQVREQNEDAFFISPDSRVFVVADGLGGHAAGEVARA
jgi:serine/threonine protein phosphatase PrpC